MDVELLARLRAAGCVFAEEEAELLAGATEDQVARRCAGEPLEQVLGWADFGGVRVRLAPGVFVPRRRTEALVRRALELLADGPVVDLCCGSGALGAAVLAARPDVEVHGADLDPAAVACARRNLPVVHEGDLFDALPPSLRGRVDVLLANVPYVPTREIDLMPVEAREHEPLLALDGGDDGLDVLRRVAAGAAEWLRLGGTLLSEVSARQLPVALGVLSAAGLAADGEDTVVSGTRPSA